VAIDFGECVLGSARRWLNLNDELAAAPRNAARLVFIGGWTIVTVELSANSDIRCHPILDALRFVFAFWVAMNHRCEFPAFANAETSVPAVWLLSHSYGTVVCGASALMGFLSFRDFAFIFHSESGRPCRSRDSSRGAMFES
jgi:hypothetical protein